MCVRNQGLNVSRSATEGDRGGFNYSEAHPPGREIGKASPTGSGPLWRCGLVEDELPDD